MSTAIIAPRPARRVLPPLGSVIPRDGATLTLLRTGRSTTVQYMGGTVLRVHAAVETLGAKPGDEYTVRYWRFAPERFVITEHGGGDRTPNGWWADEVR